MPECVVAGCTNPPSDELPGGPLPKDAIVCDDHLGSFYGGDDA